MSKDLETARKLADALAESDKAKNNVPDAATEEVAQPEPVKRRGPGRPPKSEGPAPFETIGEEKPKAAPAKRGPKPGSRNTKKNDPAELAKQIAGIHVMASLMTGIGELQLAEEEALNLARAVIGVSEQYNLAIDGKTGAAIQLIAACAMVYGPRALMIRRRLQHEKGQENNGANVVPAN